METRQELRETINELKDKLKEAQVKLQKLGGERFNPEEGETYYYVDDDTCICRANFNNCLNKDKNRYNAYNCFKTQEEAEKEADKIYIRRKLEDVARCLNGNEKIDWNNLNQPKYHIVYNSEEKCLTNMINYEYVHENSIYCLNINFLNEVIKEIGEKELVSYITND